MKDDTLREVGGAQRVMKLEPLKAEVRSGGCACRGLLSGLEAWF